MRPIVLLSLLLAFPGQIQAQAVDDPYIPFALPLFKDGLHTRYSANAIPDGGLSQALNIVLDEDVDGVVVARNGYSKYNPTAITNSLSVRGLWPFDAPDGTEYLVAFSSSSFYRSTGDGVWTAITGLDSFSRTADFDCVQTIGKLFCANGTVVISWNGTSTAAVAGAPIGNLVGKFRNRLLLSGIAGSKGRLRGSGELDETDWTVQIPGVSTTPFNIAFGGADDGEDITCLMGAYQDVFLVGKKNSLWGLYGFGRTDFEVREISREVGCIEQRSVKEKNNCLYWLSTRGVERFCGASIGRASDPIRDQIDTIVATAGNARSNIDTSQTDFEAGTLGAAGPGALISATISPGNVVGGTFTFVDTSSTSFFNSGTSDLTAIINGSEVRLSTDFPPNTPPTNAELETGLIVPWACSTAGSGADTKCGITTTDAIAGVYSASFTATCTVPGGSDYFSLINFVTGSTLTSQSNFMTATASTTTLDTTAYFGQVSFLHFNAAVSVDSADLYSGTFTALDTLTFRKQGTTGCGNYRGGLIDSVQVFADQVYNDTGTYVSKIFDTSFSTPIGGIFSATVSSGVGYNLSFRIRSSTSPNDDLWGAYSSISLGANVGLVQRYWQYQASFSITITTHTPILYDATLQGGTTGQFISQCRNPGTAITSWGQVACTFSPYAGGWAIAVATGTSCSMATRSTATWTAHSNNSIISVATASFVAYRLTNSYTAFVATGNPAAHDCTIHWSEGESRPPVASQVYRDRYYLAYTSSTLTTAVNDHLFVLDKNDKWTIFSNHNCYSLALYNRKLYCGSSTAAGQVWLLDNGDDDDGTAINSRIKTKAFNLGLPERPKKFRSLYLDLEPSPDSAQTISLSGTYFLERSTTSYSLGSVDLNEDPGSIMTSKLPFSLSNPVSGRYIQIQLESTGLNSPWRLFGGRLYYLPMAVE